MWCLFPTLSHARGPSICGPIFHCHQRAPSRQWPLVLMWHFLFSWDKTFSGWKCRHNIGNDSKRKRRATTGFCKRPNNALYLIIELWILVVMRDNSVSVCGKNRPRRFSINTLQKKETESPPSMSLFKHDAREPQRVRGICEPRVTAKPTQLSPWTCKFQIIYSHSRHHPRHRLTWLHECFWISGHLRNIIPT